MIKLGLRPAQVTKLKSLLVTHHFIHIRISVLTLENEYVNDISRRLMGGEVTIDVDAEVTRSAKIELLDPRFNLHALAEAPDDAAMHLNRMIRIVYVVMTPDRSDSYDIPLFTGPITKVERQGALLSLECQGKERLSSTALWRSKTYKKNLKKTTVIESILRDLGGERKLDIPDRKAKLPNNLSLDAGEAVPWLVAKRLAGSMNMQLFYDGRGVARLRPIPSKSLYVFTERGALLSEPDLGFTMDGVVNAVEVIGGKPKGAKKKVRYRLVAARSHALSPWRLGRNGVPRFFPEVLQDDSIKSIREARAVAKKHLRARLVRSTEVAFDSLPIPFLEELDRCRIHSGRFSSEFVLRKMTIPLTADGTSSVGYLKRSRGRKRSIPIWRL